jgi:hypothetical protein
MSLILDGTNGLSDVDGSAATPAIRGTDANTGIFFGTDIIGFSEGGVEAMRINASGNLQTLATIGVGNATPSTSGAGISFPATQSASSDANTLDDYEEGTFTPVASQLSSNPTVTYANQTGSYVKVGNTVTIHIRIGIASISGGSGQTQITGLPFAASTSSDGGIMFMQANNGAGTAGRYLMAYIGSNVTKLEIYNNDPTSGFAQPTSYPVNFTVIMSFSYITNT